MSENISLDRVAVRRLVEDHWRSLILYGRHLGETHPNWAGSQEEVAPLMRDFVLRFDEQIRVIAASMPPDQDRAFLRMVEEEGVICFEEHSRDPDGLYRRLGLDLDSNSQPRMPVSNRQGLGELAVRTAVRATVWELIWSLFRW